jgi:DNA-binding Xre family transcriptional regulator
MLEVKIMGVSYKRLWMLIIEKDLKKAQVRQMSNVSASTFSKMSKNEYVALDVLVRLCIALDCEISDIVEIVR